VILQLSAKLMQITASGADFRPRRIAHTQSSQEPQPRDEDMSDSDRHGNAWTVSPSQYFAARKAEFGLPERPRSQYLTMRDGCRIAIDVYLPQAPNGPTSGRYPTILILTPYYRRFALREGATTSEASPSAGRYRDLFVPRGYALVVVDVRGTGASFGTRDSFRSPVEREDYREIADWIADQPWSDGRIGATGISYVGAACDFLASTGHKAVKAVAPLFAVWDTWGDHYYPGGLLLKELAKTYDELMVALDHDRRELLPKFAYFKDPDFAGPAPVDDDGDGALRRAAIAQHLANFRMPDFITEFRCKDDTLPYDPEFSSSAFSPYHYASGTKPDVAVYSISGWMDGAGYANGAVARFLSLPNPRKHLLLGPWDHGARINVSPWRAGVVPEFPLLAEVLRFFDQYLMQRDAGLEREAPIHYFSLHDEEWRAAASWPPVTASRSFFLAEGGGLQDAPPAAGQDAYQVDFAGGTGFHTRYERLAAIDVRQYYDDWHGRDAAMLCYSSAPLERDILVAGHPVVSLHLAADQADVALHVYLEEVETDGRCRYVTEGMLRALHRKEAPSPAHHRTTWPFRSFARSDAAPLTPSQPALLRFALLPTAWTFRRGSRLRLAIAGADSDHYGQVPHGRPPGLRILSGGTTASAIELPWAVKE
jgi:putative CocE/NonD family hydrolase